mmetsp:Transcript_18592/g.38889  ORF Transcript_18592/g.38889 Transcript_18592/m.38889 type:complete len:132 (+) Transcript_18592:1-396(+)
MVLSGAAQTLGSCPLLPVLYVENNCKKGSKDLIQFVTSLGYTCHWVVAPYFSSANFRGNEANIFPETANSINMLCFSLSDPTSTEKAKNLPSATRIDVASRRYLLHEYALNYNGGDGTILSQLGTMDSCKR